MGNARTGIVPNCIEKDAARKKLSMKFKSKRKIGGCKKSCVYEI